MKTYLHNAIFPKLGYLGAFIVFSLIVILFSANIHAAEQKMHPLKSYSVNYELGGNTEGTKSQYSQNYGRTICWVEKSEMSVIGNSINKNEKVITKIEDGDQWIITIDLDKNTGTKMKNPMYNGLAATMKGKDPQRVQ